MSDNSSLGMSARAVPSLSYHRIKLSTDIVTDSSDGSTNSATPPLFSLLRTLLMIRRLRFVLPDMATLQQKAKSTVGRSIFFPARSTTLNSTFLCGFDLAIEMHLLETSTAIIPLKRGESMGNALPTPHPKSMAM